MMSLEVERVRDSTLESLDEVKNKIDDLVNRYVNFDVEKEYEQVHEKNQKLKSKICRLELKIEKLEDHIEFLNSDDYKQELIKNYE